MIRWYDYLVAFLAADVMTGFIFYGGMFGGLAAYGVYWIWDEVYCDWRKSKEHGK